MTSNEVGIASTRTEYRIKQGSWSMLVSKESPEYLTLLHEELVEYEGRLEIVKNGHSLLISPPHWNFRIKKDRIEQWCNLPEEISGSISISISISYTFKNSLLVIDYCARNKNPAYFNMRHHSSRSFPQIGQPMLKDSFNRASLENPVQPWLRMSEAYSCSMEIHCS